MDRNAGGIAAIVLAAGTASRYRAAEPEIATKLVAELEGKPLVRHVAEAALASRARPVVVVIGHAAAAVTAALAGLAVEQVANPHFATGLASSLRAGIAALPDGAQGALVLLGDMPGVGAALLDRLIDVFDGGGNADAVVPLHDGRRGNPVLLGRALFAAVEMLDGDEGARRLLRQARVCEVEVADPAVHADIDDPEMLRRARADLVQAQGLGQT